MPSYHLLEQIVPGWQCVCVSPSKSLQYIPKCCLHTGQALLASNLDGVKGSLSWPLPQSWGACVHHYQSIPVAASLTTFSSLFAVASEGNDMWTPAPTTTTPVSSLKPFCTGNRWILQLHTTLEGLSSTKSITPLQPARSGTRRWAEEPGTQELLEHKDVHRFLWASKATVHWTQNVLPKWVTVDCVYGFSCSQQSPHRL